MTKELRNLGVPLARVSALLGVLCVAAGARVASAEQVIFTIDHAQSSVSISGTDDIYGAFVPQSPGSLTTNVSGHIVASFDPLTHTPSSLQLIGGHGYVKADMAHVGSPSPDPANPSRAVPTSSPANLAGRAGAGSPFTFAIRDYTWDFTSGVMAPTAGVFPTAQSSYVVLNGAAALYDSGFGSGLGLMLSWIDLTPDQLVAGGSWSLAESAPGSGDWTLSLSGQLDNDDYLFLSNTGMLAIETTIVATAHFGAGNIDSVGPADTEATAGGVSATFNQPTSGGTFTVQKLPDATGLSQEALAASGANPIFSLSTEALSVNPQIWNVDFVGDLGGATATLVFNYDPLLLPPGLDENSLGIWHFDANSQEWNFGGTVDPDANTITFVTDNFSPFQLGVFVPEPSTIVLAGLGMAGLLFWLSQHAPLAARRRTYQ